MFSCFYATDAGGSTGDACARNTTGGRCFNFLLDSSLNAYKAFDQFYGPGNTSEFQTRISSRFVRNQGWGTFCVPPTATSQVVCPGFDFFTATQTNGLSVRTCQTGTQSQPQKHSVTLSTTVQVDFGDQIQRWTNSALLL